MANPYDHIDPPSRADGSYASVQVAPGRSEPGAMSPEAQALQPRYDEPIQAQAVAPMPLHFPADDSPYARLEHAPPDQLRDLGMSARGGGEQGVAGLAGLYGDLQGLGQRVGDWSQAHGFLSANDRKNGEAMSHFFMPLDAPGSSAVTQSLAKVDPGINYLPETPAGHFVHTAASMVPGALMGGGGIAPRIASVLAGAAGSDLAGYATEGTAAEPYARFAGAALGGGLGHAGTAVAGDLMGSQASQGRLLSGALHGVTDDHLSEARALMEQGHQAGVPITAAEALQHVTGGATGMGRVQRAVESSPRGAAVLAPMMRDRPDNVRQAVTSFADQIAPATDSPSSIGLRAQTAGQGVLDNIRGNINASAKPFYDALPGQIMPGYGIDPMTGAVTPGFNHLAADPSYAAALAELRGNPELNGPIAHLPDNDLAVVNETSKQLQTGAKAMWQTEANPGGNNRLSGLRGDAKGLADTLASEVSPDYAKARETVSTGSRAFLEPAEAGPVGQIAKPDRTIPQYRSLFPAQPLEGGAQETAQALRMLNHVDPTVGPALTRQHIVNSLNEATQNLPTGQNAYGGAKFAAQIAGNPEQDRTLDLALHELGGEPLAGHGDHLIDVLSATGKRLPPGGGEFDMTGGAPISKAAGVALAPWLWPHRIAGAYQNFAASRNAGQLAQMLTAAPDVVTSQLGAARARPDTGQALLAQLLLQGAVASRDNKNAPQ